MPPNLRVDSLRRRLGKLYHLGGAIGRGAIAPPEGLHLGHSPVIETPPRPCSTRAAGLSTTSGGIIHEQYDPPVDPRFRGPAVGRVACKRAGPAGYVECLASLARIGWWQQPGGPQEHRRSRPVLLLRGQLTTNTMG